MHNNTVIVIVGPTASGKTSLAIEAAKRYNAEIVSADSMQIYKGMDIATAKPTAEERSEVKHHLIDFVEPSENFSAAMYKKCADEAIEEIIGKGKLPIMAGGTGLYVDTVINNTTFFDYPDNNDVRQSLEKRADEEGIEALYAQLCTIDSDSAAVLHLNDRKRIIRALEVYYLTGKTITEQKLQSHNEKSKYRFCMICLTAHDRQFLYDRIDQRVDMMLEAGLIEEAEKFFSSAYSKTAKQAIGYKELKPYFDNEITLEEAVEKLKTETRRYAKRQLTWFRRYKDINRIYIDEKSDETVAQRCFKIIEKFEETENEQQEQ